MTIIVSINGTKIEMTEEEARILYFNLQDILYERFKNGDTPVPDRH